MWGSVRLLLLLTAATGAAALSCFACVPESHIAGVSIPSAIANKTASFPRCSALRPADPGLPFEMSCPPGLDQSCILIRDDRGNEMRSCFTEAERRCTKTSNKGQVLCTCDTDFCNTAPLGTPRLPALLLSAVVWALTARP